MNAAEADLTFPILAIVQNSGSAWAVWGIPSLHVLERCGRRTLKEGLQSGMEIIDSGGRHFRITAVRKVGRDGAFLPWLLWSLVSTPQYRVDHELEPGGTLSLEQIKQRVSAAVRRDPDYWLEGEEPEVATPKFITRLERAKSFKRLFNLVGIDDFRAH